MENRQATVRFSLGRIASERERLGWRLGWRNTWGDKGSGSSGRSTRRPKAMGLLENLLLTEVKFSKGRARYSADQKQTNISVGDAIRTLESKEYSKAVSRDGAVTVLQKVDNIYRFYPKSSSDGVPSASLTVAGQKKPVLKIRFVGSENGN